MPSSTLTNLPAEKEEERERGGEREGLVGRKRSSSARDSMELVARSDGEEMGTVLQEADSTVIIEHPQVVSMEEASPKKLRDLESGGVSLLTAHSDSSSLKSLLERTLPHSENVDLPEARHREGEDSNGSHAAESTDSNSTGSGESCCDCSSGYSFR